MTRLTFPTTDINQIGQALQQAERCDHELTLRQAVQQLLPMIQAKRQAGWRYTDIAAFLRDQGLPLSAALLSQYYRDSLPGPPARARQRRESRHAAGMPAPSRPAMPAPLANDQSTARPAATVPPSHPFFDLDSARD